MTPPHLPNWHRRSGRFAVIKSSLVESSLIESRMKYILTAGLAVLEPATDVEL